MAKILLSIKPEYAKKIIKRTKKFEFRRRLPKEPVDSIIIYSTSPDMKVIAEVEVLEILALSNDSLWNLTKSAAGISRPKFFEYFKGCEVAYAFRLGKVSEYNPSLQLSDFGIQKPPQSFMYIPK